MHIDLIWLKLVSKVRYSTSKLDKSCSVRRRTGAPSVWPLLPSSPCGRVPERSFSHVRSSVCPRRCRHATFLLQSASQHKRVDRQRSSNSSVTVTTTGSGRATPSRTCTCIVYSIPSHVYRYVTVERTQSRHLFISNTDSERASSVRRGSSFLYGICTVLRRC